MCMRLLANWLFGLMLLLATAVSNAGQHALLVGISDYSDPRIPDLEGPANDVQALREVLIRNWQFADNDITTLLDAQATEAAILDAIDALYDSTVAGDDIVIYYSGHGTSAADPDFGARVNLPDGTGAIVGSDFSPEKLSRQSFSAPADDGLLVGRFDIKPRLQALDKDRNVLVIFDACFSGNASRSANSIFVPKRKRLLDLTAYLPPLEEDITLAQNTPNPPTQKTRSFSIRDAENFAYQNTVYFGASAEDQFAVDISSAEISAGLVTTIDGKPHGAFTDSLLRALWDQSATSSPLSFIQLFNRAINHFNTWCKSCGHTPVSLPTAGSLHNELLGRHILSPSLLLSDGKEYEDIYEPALQETLIVDGTQLAMRGMFSGDADSDNTAPDIVFTATETYMSAYASDGQLIANLPLTPSADAMEQWLAGRQWLKRRMMRDLNNEHGDLQVSFRQPLTSNRVTDGEFVHFNVLSETPAHLVVLLLDAHSNLSLLYPISTSARDAVLPALQAQRIPRHDEPQIQVTPPWGTDTVVFYSLPVMHSLKPVLQEMASLTTIPMTHPALRSFEAALDENAFQYSAMTMRIVAVPKEPTR